MRVPEELLTHILEQTPVVVSEFDGRKQGWEFFRGFSRASHLFRDLALTRWFSTLSIYEEEDWEYLCDHMWITKLVRTFHCSGEALKYCCWIRIGGPGEEYDTPSGLIAELKGMTRKILASFSRLEAVVCDMTQPQPWNLGWAKGELLKSFSHALPHSVLEFKLVHATTLPAHVVCEIASSLPALRVLDLGKCTVHCPCTLCVQATQGGKNGYFTQHCDSFERSEFAARMPRLVHLQKLGFNVHLTPHSVANDHRRDHDYSLAMADCSDCPPAAAQATLEAERTAVMALAEALPALKTVDWCSLFCRSGRRRFTIRRDRSGPIGLEMED